MVLSVRQHLNQMTSKSEIEKEIRDIVVDISDVLNSQTWIRTSQHSVCESLAVPRGAGDLAGHSYNRHSPRPVAVVVGLRENRSPHAEGWRSTSESEK